ncbi:MAG: prepilin peptidase [Pseudobdellovibrionaceae bacterium]
MISASFIALILISLAFVLLAVLVAIDSKTMLLPNRYVFPFGLLGPLFHIVLDFKLLSEFDMVFGGIGAVVFLMLVRAYGNWRYGQESLGLGDVKLLCGAGFWLGPTNTLFAISAGAAFTLIQGIFVAKKRARETGEFTLKRLKIPAGPGFCFGIALMMVINLLIPLLKWVLDA